MEFLQVFLYTISGFSLMSLTDISNVRHLEMDKLIFVKSNNNVVDMIANLQDDYILVIMNDVSNFLNVPFTFKPKHMNFTGAERDLIRTYGHMMNLCECDYIFNFTQGNVVISSLMIQETHGGLFGSVSSMLKEPSKEVLLDIDENNIVINYINYMKRFKNLLNKYDSYEETIFNTFKNYDLAIGL